MRSDDYLFRGKAWHDVSPSLKRDALEKVNALPLSILRNPALAGQIDQILEKAVPPAPKLIGNAEIETKEEGVERPDYGDRATITEIVIYVSIKFAGEAAYFKVRPSRFSSVLPNAYLRYEHVSFVIHRRGRSTEEVNAEIASTIETVNEYLGWLHNDVEKLRKDLRPILMNAAEERRKKLEETENFAAGLKFSIPE